MSWISIVLLSLKLEPKMRAPAAAIIVLRALSGSYKIGYQLV